jgi:hypothetical protein
VTWQPARRQLYWCRALILTLTPLNFG